MRRAFSASALAIAALTAACMPPVEEAGKRTERFQLVSVYPPKHYGVELKSVQTGQTHKRVYVSKHCNDWRKVGQPLIGQEFDLTVTRYKRGDEEYERFDQNQLLQTFCRKPT